MKITYITTGLGRGGAEAMLVKLMAHRDERTVQPHIVSLTGEGVNAAALRALDVPVTCLSLGGVRHWMSAIAQLREVLKSKKPDLIQGWMYHGNLAAVLTGIAPASMSIRQCLYDMREEKMATRGVIYAGAWMSKRARSIIYNSTLSAQHHEARGYATDRRVILPNGFELDRFRFNSELRAQARAQFNIPAQALVVGHVARFHHHKGQQTFLEAMSQVAQSHDVFGVMVGDDITEGNPALTPWLSQPSLKGRLRLLGPIANLAPVYPMFDLLCSSSHAEAFPNVIGEAMACEVPVVATDVGDCAYVVADTGILAPARNPPGLAAALLRMIGLSYEARSKLGQRARQRIQDHFSIEAITRAYEHNQRRDAQG